MISQSHENDLQFQVVAAGANPVLITRGIEKTTKALVSELKLMSKEVMFVLSFLVSSIKIVPPP